ncbi:MAG: hypothetical protein KF716_24250 [Anaerolineae bacterium]|nr:hypothetical protein [Anaerolineae bacterium]
MRRSLNPLSTWKVILLTAVSVLLMVGLLAGIALPGLSRLSTPPRQIEIAPEVKHAILASTVLIQLGYGGGNGRDCIHDYDRQDCSLAFHFGLGTLLSRHQILTHDHLQVIGDDAGTLAEIQKYEWIKFSGYAGKELIVATKEITFAPESAPFGMLILQLPPTFDLGIIGVPAAVAPVLTYAQTMGAVVYYPSMVLPIDSIYPYTSWDIWDKMTVGAGRVGSTRMINNTGFYAVAYADPIVQMQNGDCGGGTFMLIDGKPQLVGTHNYTTASFYLFLPVAR